jgi:NADH:ubiquinone oxidoreductase subunit H
MLLGYIVFVGVVAFVMLFFGEYSKQYWFCALGSLLILFLGIWMMLDGTGIQYQSGQTTIIYNATTTTLAAAPCHAYPNYKSMGMSGAVA